MTTKVIERSHKKLGKRCIEQRIGKFWLFGICKCRWMDKVNAAYDAPREKVAFTRENDKKKYLKPGKTGQSSETKVIDKCHEKTENRYI